MRKVFHFDAPREKYRCDAVVVWCFDNRFELGFRKFLKRSGIATIDPVKIAGGAKALASPGHEWEREFVFGQIEKSIRLHGTDHVILMMHSDCGAYGGLEANFGGDPRREAETLRTELLAAADNVRRRYPGIRVSTYFVDFEGVWDAAEEVEA